MQPDNSISGPLGCNGPTHISLERPTELGQRHVRPFAWVDGIPVFGSDDFHDWFVPPEGVALDLDGLPPPNSVLRVAVDREQIACATAQRRICRERGIDRTMIETLLGTNPNHWAERAFALFELADAGTIGFPVGRPSDGVTDGFPALGHPVASFASMPAPRTRGKASPAAQLRRTMLAFLSQQQMPRLALWRCRDRAHLVGVSCGGPWAVPICVEFEGAWRPTVALPFPAVSTRDEPSDEKGGWE